MAQLPVVWLGLLFALPAAAQVQAGPERGAPWPRHTVDDSSRGADGARLADVNGDGLLDVATGWEEGGTIRVYINPGPDKAKTKWPAVTVGEVRSPEDAVFADLDGDGATDVVSSCEGNVKTVWVHWAPSDPAAYLDRAAWRTEAIPASKDRTRWMFCLPLDLGGRHGVDLVAGAKNGGAEIGWFASPADPRDLAAWTWRTLRPAGWIMSLEAADMDADGDQDILFSDRKGARRGCYWLENPGFGAPRSEPWREHTVGATDKQVMFLCRADLDRDGLEDVLVATSGDDIVWLRRTAADGRAWETHTIPMPPDTGTGKAVEVADFDLDGKPDVVFTCEHARGKSGVMWLSYRDAPTNPRWDAHEISGEVGTKYDLIQLLDLDDDGNLDVLTCEEGENLGVIWYENPARPERAE